MSININIHQMNTSSKYVKKEDLEEIKDVLNDLDSIREAANNYKGTVNSVKINDTVKTPTDGVVDLGSVTTVNNNTLCF
jgi:hypothetical protein